MVKHRVWESTEYIGWSAVHDEKWHGAPWRGGTLERGVRVPWRGGLEYLEKGG